MNDIDRWITVPEIASATMANTARVNQSTVVTVMARYSAMAASAAADAAAALRYLDLIVP